MRRIALLVAILWPSAVAADVTRYALVVGHDEGRADEEPLRYAEEDARRFHEVLAEVGGFRPENTVLIRGGRADRVREALIALNDRIRTAGAPAMLVVFYSGHADAEALHLGDTLLPLRQLEQLVRGSAASLRLLIVDACRSGALTRVKGGARVRAPRVVLGQRLPIDGVVFWSSSSANEDAQESDELGGSFFSHHLISGLLGAADDDRDGAITLGEAYRHAYQGTLRATSKTLAGAQHATFRHETHGVAEVVLTTLAARERALISFPAGRDYLILSGAADGRVVAEVGARDAERAVSLRPGRYFVRGRARDHLLEGMLTARAGERRALDERAFDRVEYARLVRKGGGGRARSDRLEVGYTVRSSLWSDASPCQGLVVGWAVDAQQFSLSARGRACRGTFDNAFLDATTDELGAELRVVHARDLRRLTVGGGAVGGVSLLHQRFDAMGDAPPARTSTGAQLGLTAQIGFDVRSDVYLSAEVDGLTSFFVQEQQTGDRAARAVFSLRGNLLIGKRW
jgi:hypothetical protein